LIARTPDEFPGGDPRVTSARPDDVVFRGPESPPLMTSPDVTSPAAGSSRHTATTLVVTATDDVIACNVEHAVSHRLSVYLSARTHISKTVLLSSVCLVITCKPND